MAQLKDLLVLGQARIIGNLYGTLRGNADTASSAAKLTTARTISLGGNLSGSASFDGTGNITIAGQVNTVRDSNNGRAIKITYSKAGQASTSYLGSWNGYELGAISPANITAGAASKLTVNGGSATQPVYFSNGKPVACTYTLSKSVPSNAVFTDTNNKVTQTAVTASDYTNWRPIIWGASNSGTEGFTPTTTTDGTFTTSTLSVQPSSGTIRATTFKGALNGNASTASTATKLSTSAGSATQPVYFSNGKPVACTYSINKSVPANAVFTDTVYTLPAAGSTLGGVKTTSTVTSASGYTACPIIGGVPYYKDTNTTYSLSSFGVSVSATELNYTKGVTSAIQTQLNGKASSSHTHNYAGSGSVGGSANSAVKLDSSAGSSSLPVYFSNGKPVAINAAIRTFSGSLATNGWKSLGGRETWSGIMAAYNTANNTSWNSEAYSSTLVFGASDTKGMLDLGYSSPIVVFGGSNAADGSDNNPKWYFKLFGANGATYTYPSSTKTLCASDGSNASGNWGINASSASKLATARSIALTGSVTGSANFDGSGNISIATTTNHTHSQYLTSHQDISGKVNKSGDTLTGRLTKAGGGSWISDRTNVAIFGTAANKDSYNCVVGQKTPNGAWTIGNLASNDKLVFNYTTDTNYNSGSNASTAVYLPTTGGTIALTSQIPTSLPANGGNSSTVNGHSVNADVPSGAKFTDTNTWRGIQNNLTSTSTSDSLSAAQGKVLNDKFASYVPTSRTVNGKALSANISLTASDVGAAASGHTHNKTATATLSASKWSNKTQSVSVSGVTASNTVIVSAAPSSHTNYCEASIYCSAQGSGTLTFTCDTVPTADITANIVILGG